MDDKHTTLCTGLCQPCQPIQFWFKLVQSVFVLKLRCRRLLGRDIAANVKAALVLTWLDYCNALLAGLPYSTTAPLQCLINAATRLVYGLRPRDHVTDATIELHWLPIRARINFKLCLLVHSALKGQSPSYIAELLQSVTTRHPGLCSQLITIYNASLVPENTNIPVGIQTTSRTPAFKKILKTFLFHKFYDISVHWAFIYFTFFHIC